jgi:hypothetical protein
MAHARWLVSLPATADALHSRLAPLLTHGPPPAAAARTSGSVPPRNTSIARLRVLLLWPYVTICTRARRSELSSMSLGAMPTEG